MAFGQETWKQSGNGWRRFQSTRSSNLARFTRAAVRYHAIKMEETNKIIKELWTSTYQGTGTSRRSLSFSVGGRPFTY